ncbi:Uncharacterised protein [uncultured archaeon]|nr:Uncharacterised protein [uncultured archaeon]
MDIPLPDSAFFLFVIQTVVIFERKVFPKG